jgi:hypothetical protein
MTLDVEDITVSKNSDCGCYEEQCLIWPFDVVLHLEPDGTGDAFFDNGDYYFEENFPAATIEELRRAAVDRVLKLYEKQMPLRPDQQGGLKAIFSSHSSFVGRM